METEKWVAFGYTLVYSFVVEHQPVEKLPSLTTWPHTCGAAVGRKRRKKKKTWIQDFEQMKKKAAENLGKSQQTKTQCKKKQNATKQMQKKKRFKSAENREADTYAVW